MVILVLGVDVVALTLGPYLIGTLGEPGKCNEGDARSQSTRCHRRSCTHLPNGCLVRRPTLNKWLHFRGISGVECQSMSAWCPRFACR